MDRRLGATPQRRGGAHFEVWAPRAQTVDLEVVAPKPVTRRLRRREDGYHVLDAPDIKPGTRYFYRLDGGERRPDPVSRHQPEGLFGPSESTDLSKFPWTDDEWKGHRQQDLVVYELHVGTYTPEGTFESMIPHLPDLAKLGVTAIELMPVAQFSGTRNWGYDGVYLFAPQHSYGGPRALQRLVDAAHDAGLSVILDVVYNHVGPEGNTLPDFAPYFNNDHATPWGAAINLDGRGSDDVRRFLVENALQWLVDYHMDGLRLDAVHAMADYSAKTFMEELADACHAAADDRGYPFHLIAESNANDPRYVRPAKEQGWGLDAVWNDDFSHALYTFTTHDPTDYSGDYPDASSLAKAFGNAYVFDGTYSKYRQRRHGRTPVGLPGHRFLVCADNHDQAGNRANGERLAHLVSFEMLKVSAAAVILSPFLPMLFMGEEYAEPAPFLYFTDHSGATLRDAVTRGRKDEFKGHGWKDEPADHAALETFQRSTLRHDLKTTGHHGRMLAYYRRLLALRKTHPVLRRLDHREVDARARVKDHLVTVLRGVGKRRTLLVLHSGNATKKTELDLPRGTWRLLLDSKAADWNGPGTAHASELRSTGHVRLELAGEAALLYETGGGK